MKLIYMATGTPVEVPEERVEAMLSAGFAKATAKKAIAKKTGAKKTGVAEEKPAEE